MIESVILGGTSLPLDTNSPLVSVEVVDAQGAERDTVTLRTTRAIDLDELESRIVTVDGVPYDVQSVNWEKEQRDITIRGTRGLDFESLWGTLEATTDARITSDLVAQLAAIFTEDGPEPYASWASLQEGDVQYILNLIAASLFASKSLGDVRNTLAGYGLTVSYETQEGFIIYPLYPTFRPTQEAPDPPDIPELVAQSDTEAIQAGPPFSIPDRTNRPGSYEDQRIVVSGQDFAFQVEETIEWDEGTGTPPIFLGGIVGRGLAKIQEEVTRWTLQNTSVTSDLTQVADYTPELAPNDIVKVPPGYYESIIPMDDDGFSTWRVNKINRKWSARDGHSRVLSLVLWQGYFFRLSAFG